MPAREEYQGRSAFLGSVWLSVKWAHKKKQRLEPPPPLLCGAPKGGSLVEGWTGGPAEEVAFRMGSQAAPSPRVRWGFWRGRAGSLEPEARSRPGILARALRSRGGDYGQTALGGSVPCSRCSARWPGSSCSAPGRANGAKDPGTSSDGEVGMRRNRRLGKVEGGKGDGERNRGTEGQKRAEIKERVD